MDKNILNSIPKEKTLSFETIQSDLNDLIETFINKIDREFSDDLMPGARILFLTFANVAKNTYKTILYISAEKPPDPSRKIEYALSSIPLLRLLLEEVFTVAFISEDLEKRIEWYYKAGWRETKEEYDRFNLRYGSDTSWGSWFTAYKKELRKREKLYGITTEEIADLKKIQRWPTPGKMKNYISDEGLKNFLQYLHDWFYKRFSQAAHLTWPGLAFMGSYFLDRDGEYNQVIIKTRSDCVFRSMTLLLALFSEMEHMLNFNLKQRVQYFWTFIGEYWDETKELFDKRYGSLLASVP